MKVSTKIFLCYLVMSAVCLYFPFDWVLDTMRTRYLEGVEDPLVDQANILAAQAEYEMETGTFDPQRWSTFFDHAYKRTVDAKIYKLLKTNIDTRVYITNSKGIVVFHSVNPALVGEDYSMWRDVTRTLRGEYGARTSRFEDAPEKSSVLYVAAPIVLNNAIAGVLTVGKPTTNITWFVEQAKFQVVVTALLALLAAGILSYLISRWITVPISRLTHYANQVRDGQRAEFPQLGNSEIGEMGHALKEMKTALDGKQYVEQYIQNLTHEIKSPLSAIRGASELLEEPMSDAQRARFLANIKNESLRIQDIIDRMLDLSTLESKSKLTTITEINVSGLVNTVMESFEPIFSLKNMNTEVKVPEGAMITGDAFLLHQALGNLVQNAVDFSAEQGKITVSVEETKDGVQISVKDRGAGIAPYAESKVFENPE